MKPRELKEKVERAKKLKCVSKDFSNLERASEAHREASLIRQELNEYYANKHNRNLAAPPKDYVYFLTNDSFSTIKIGFTTRTILKRVAELNSSTSLPTGFKLVGYIVSANAAKLEKDIHTHFDRYRINPKREFFNLAFDDAVAIIESTFSVRVMRENTSLD